MTNQIAGSTLTFAQERTVGAAAINAGSDFWHSQLHRLAAAGFDCVDFVDAWFPLDGLSDPQLAELRSALGEATLKLVGVSVVRASVIDPADGEVNLERTLRSVEAAAQLGARVLSIGFHRPLTAEQKQGPFWMRPPPHDDRHEANWQLAAARVRTVADRCAENGLEVSLELHEGTLLADAAGALRILELVERDNVGINPDIGNLVRVPAPLQEHWLDTIQRCNGHINYWHVKNYLRLEHPSGVVVTTPAPLGQGEINYRSAIQLARAAGYSGPLCVEHYGGDPLWASRQGRDYLLQILQEER